jgi:hypothetical protein
MSGFIDKLEIRSAAIAREWLKFDYLCQGKPGAFPDWFRRTYSKEAHDAAVSRFSDEIAGGLGDGETQYAPARRTLFARTEYEEFHFDPGKTEPDSRLFVYAPSRSDKKSVKILKV